MANGKETLFWYPETDKFYGFPSDSADFYKEKYPSFQEVSIFRDPKGNEQWLPESKLKDAATALPGYDLVVPEVIKPPEEPPPEEKPKKPARKFFEGEISEDEYMQEMIAAGKDVNKEAILETAGFMGSKETGEDEPNFAVPFASLPSIVSDSDLPKEEQFSFNAAKYDLPDTYTITDQNLNIESAEIYKWLEQSPLSMKPILDDYEKTIETINAGGREIEEIKDKLENINKQLEAFSYEEIGEGEEKKKVYTAKDEHEHTLLTNKLNKYNALIDSARALGEQFDKDRGRLIEIDKIYQKQQMDHEVNYSRYMELRGELESRGAELKEKKVGENLKRWLAANEAVQVDQEEQTWGIWDSQTGLFIYDPVEFRDITSERRDPDFNVPVPSRLETQMLREGYLRYQSVNLDEGFSAGTPWHAGAKATVDAVAGGSLRTIGVLANLVIPDYYDAWGEKKRFGDKFVNAAEWLETLTTRVYLPDAQKSTPQGFMAVEPKSLKDLEDLRKAGKIMGETFPLFFGLMLTYLKNPTLGKSLMFTVEGGEAARRISEYEKETGKTIDPRVAAAVTATIGGVNTILESIGLDAILGRNSFIREKVFGKITRALIGITVETLTEGAQGANQELIEVIYQTFEEANLGEEVAEAFIADAISAVPMAFMGGGMGAISQRSAETAKRRQSEAYERAVATEYVRSVYRDALTESRGVLTEQHYARIEQRKHIETLERKEVSRQIERELIEAKEEEAYFTEEMMEEIPQLPLDEEREIIFGLGYTEEQYVRLDNVQRRAVAHFEIPPGTPVTIETPIEAEEAPVTVEAEEVEAEVPVEEEVAEEVEIEPEVEEPTIATKLGIEELTPEDIAKMVKKKGKPPVEGKPPEEEAPEVEAVDSLAESLGFKKRSRTVKRIDLMSGVPSRLPNILQKPPTELTERDIDYIKEAVVYGGIRFGYNQLFPKLKEQLKERTSLSYVRNMVLEGRAEELTSQLPEWHIKKQLELIRDSIRSP